MKVFLASVIAALLFVAPVKAWGPEGHEIVAIIAADNLTTGTKTEVDRLLSGVPMWTVANYADLYRASHPETGRWHYVDIPYTASTYRASRDCQQTTEGDCVIKALAREEAILGDKTKSDADRTMALKFVIHLVGDIHQPFHAIERTTAGVPDRGGNEVKVKLFGSSTSLHGVWDSGLINHAALSSDAYAKKIESDVTFKPADLGGTTIAWAQASHAIGKNAYVANGDKLGQSYYDAHIGEVERQLDLAGRRLAVTLSKLLGP